MVERIFGRGEVLRAAFGGGVFLGTALLVGCGDSGKNIGTAESIPTLSAVSFEALADLPVVSKKPRIIENPVLESKLDANERLALKVLRSANEQDLPVWYKQLNYPDSLNIMTLGFLDKIQQIAPSSDVNRTPDEGIARDDVNRFPLLWIYGHSNWLGKAHDFGNIQRLNLGNLISVYDNNSRPFFFTVESFDMHDHWVDENVDDVTLLLQTTAKELDKWKINQHEALARVPDFRDQDFAHANFFVKAIPVRMRVQEQV